VTILVMSILVAILLPLFLGGRDVNIIVSIGDVGSKTPFF